MADYPDPDPPGPFTDGRHALYVGWVLGIGMRHGLDLLPTVDPDGYYTDRLLLVVPGGPTITLVVPPPPADWELVPE